MGILGYYEGKPNGTYDQQTLDAIRTYQKDRGLSPDDTIGAATRNELVKDIALALNGNRAPPSPAPIQGGGSSSELGGAILDYKGLVVPPVAENGSYYGELNANGVPKTVHVDGYYRKDGTYVRGHYRSAPGTNPHKPH